MSTEVETTPQPEQPAAASDATESNASAPTKNKRKAADAASAALPELEVDLSLPEPPSKRAKRALKKGKVLPPKASGQAHSDADTDAKPGKPAGKEAKERSQFGIWIGNLPFTVTRPQLFKWLVDSSGGAIAEADITRVNLPTSGRKGRPPPPPRGGAAETETATAAGPQNKGFAYVDFSTYEAQVAATALSETELAGRRVLIKDSKSFEGRPKPAATEGAGAVGSGASGSATGGAAAAAAAVSGSTKIFVGNLGFDTTDDDLRQQFSPCGHVAWAKVATFPDNTEKCRGYGWVQFGVEKGTADENDEDDGDGKTKTTGAETATPATPAEAAASAVKGFVRIKETIDTEDDFVAEAKAVEGAEEEEAEAAAKPRQPQPPRTKTRKWWVNMLKGRMLKIQFAEDDQTRYKKRFGKDRPRKEEEGQQQKKRPRQDKRQTTEAQQEAAAADGTADKPYKLQDLSIAQRTGAVTASLGKKTLLE